MLALPGTQVSIAARALTAGVREASLLLEAEGAEPRELPVEVHDGRLTATIEVRARGSWRFILGGGAHRVAEPEAHRIDLEPDRPPRVDLYAPADPLEVAGPRRVELAWSVDDDYGLGAIELVWKAGDAPEKRRIIEPQPRRARARSGQDRVGPRRARAEPGVRVAYHLEAKDNDTVPGPNVGRSKTLTLSMFSPREKQERAMSDEQQLVEAAVQLLGDRLEVKRDDDDQLVDAFTRIHSKAEALLLVVVARGAVGGRGAAEEGGRRQGRQAARSARSTRGWASWCATRSRRSASCATSGARRERRCKRGRGAAAGEGQRRAVDELERDVIALDDLLGKQRLEELLAVADEMAATRDRLKQLMAEYKKTRSAETKKEIERELRELERKLAELAREGAAARLRAARSVPQQRGDGRQRPAEEARRGAPDDGARRHRSGDGRARQAVAVARPHDVVDGAGL